MNGEPDTFVQINSKRSNAKHSIRIEALYTGVEKLLTIPLTTDGDDASKRQSDFEVVMFGEHWAKICKRSRREVNICD